MKLIDLANDLGNEFYEKYYKLHAWEEQTGYKQFDYEKGDFIRVIIELHSKNYGMDQFLRGKLKEKTLFTLVANWLSCFYYNAKKDELGQWYSNGYYFMYEMVSDFITTEEESELVFGTLD